ncbi:HAMP domain-containing sensor histidine kinase [Kribbella alba]|uniref:sensor histidine kinase n=1 Tax=Kribbella alba TaxID=190197 RepID=UPI0031DBE410
MRLRSALASVVVVAVALAAGAAVLIWLLDRSLTQGAADAALQRARTISTSIPGGELNVIRQNVVAGPSEQSVAQVIGPKGTIIAASPQIDGEPPLTSSRPGPGGVVTLTREQLPVGDGESYVVSSLGVAGPDGAYVVLVAQSLKPVQSSVTTVTALVLTGLPVLLLIVGGATFVLAGWSLRPVEAIRRRVADISGRDISGRVPVPEAQDEIARLANTMNAMLARLESAQAAQRRFVADASHELRSPLATLRANVELGANPHTASASSTETVLAETNRLERLVTDLLLLAKADEHGLRIDRTDVDLDDLVQAERTRLRAEPGLTVGGRVQAVQVRGDRHQLGQALRNLVDNAVRHTTSRVDLDVRPDGRYAVIEVADDGPGVPADMRERVFDRFVRLDDSRARSAGGSGLGLAIVREVITAHGGTVTVEDTTTGGAVFRIRLPIASDEPPRR